MRPIFVLNMDGKVPEKAFEAAKVLAEGLQHEVCLLGQPALGTKHVALSDLSRLTKTIAINDASLLIIEVETAKQIKFYLKVCRELRIPYLFVKPHHDIAFKKVGVPVTFLMEDKEKAPFASAMGRFLGSQVTLYCPKDYGTKAKSNVAFIAGLLDSFQLNYNSVQHKADSFAIEHEVTRQAKQLGEELLIVSASREYGLDDIIFGSKEYKLLTAAEVPVMVINPRGDLYALCD